MQLTPLDPDNFERCHICNRPLHPHPLYRESGTKYCSEDGDFYVQRLRDRSPAVIFVPFKQVPRARRNASNPAPIRCNETGNIYYGLKAAAASLGCSESAISKNILGHIPNVKGFTFTRV